MAIYGGQVCPYIEGLGLDGAGLIFLLTFGGGLLARSLALRVFGPRVAPIDSPRLILHVDVLIFVAMALGVALFDRLVFGFPWVSGVKVSLGFATVGLFASLDLALAEERALVDGADASPVFTASAGGRSSSLGRRLTVFAIAAVTLAFVDIVLVVSKDLTWLAGASPEDLPRARMAVLTEVLFIGVVLLALTINVIVGYARNVSILLQRELEALDSVRTGARARYVPVVTNDEFGRIAVGTNEVIRELDRSRELRSVLGKFVGGTVAEYMLEQVERDRDVLLGGTRRKLVILIADIREFTRRCDQHPPEQVVSDLNRYFSHIVPLIEQHGGIIDKFIGDGVMAVFGLDGGRDATDRALQCAREMVDTIPMLADELHEPIHIGVGIARGEVVLGNVGSPERLEFTAIGAPVNLAARLEALTKATDVDIAMDDRTIDKLSDKRGLRSVGHHDVKGKAMPIHVFGWQSARRGQHRLTSTGEAALEGA